MPAAQRAAMVTPPGRSGWVYILTNRSMPGLLKIGHTSKTPVLRAAELTASTGVAHPFVVAWAHPVIDHAALEALVHGQLAAFRVNRKREFFHCSVADAIGIIEQEAAVLLMPWWRAWLHRQRHPEPATRRQRARPSPQRRYRQGDSTGLLAVLGGGIAVYVLTFRPDWVPPGVMHLLWRLPHF